MVPKALFLATLLSAAIGICKPLREPNNLLDGKHTEENTTIANEFLLEKRMPYGRDDMQKRWNDLAGGPSFEDQNNLKPQKKQIQEQSGRRIPVSQFNCENQYLDSKYSGNFHQICLNFCWRR